MYDAGVIHIAVLVAVVTVAAPAILYVLGYQLYALRLLWRYHATRGPDPEPVAAATTLPAVAIQLPVYNEGALVDRVLGSAIRLDYPADRLEIQLLDDSDDPESKAIAVAAVAAARRARPDLTIRHLRRADRSGFKAGNLRHGLARTDAPFLAVFDADFVIPPDFLMRVMPHFADPTVGVTQARWRYLNDQDPFTHLQAQRLDAHQMFDQTARARSALPVIFHGTAGVWRRTALVDAGAWDARTEVEDIEASIRAAAAGWRVAYLDRLRVASELPETVDGYVVQHMRWRRGGVRCALHYTRTIWSAPMPLRARLDLLARVHGCWSALAGLVMLLSAFPVFWLCDQAGMWMAGGVPYGLALMLSVVITIAEGHLMAADPEPRRGPALRRVARLVPWNYLLLTLGMLMPLSVATLQGFAPGRRWTVTPKSGSKPAQVARMAPPAYALATLGLAAVMAGLAVLSGLSIHPVAFAFTVLCAVGSGAVGLAMLAERAGRTVPWHRLLPPRRPEIAQSIAAAKTAGTCSPGPTPQKP